MPSKDKLMFADYVIDTSGTMEGTREQVVRLHRELKKLADGNQNRETPV